MEKDRTGIVTLRKLIIKRAPYALIEDWAHFSSAEEYQLSDFLKDQPDNIVSWINDHFAEPKTPKPKGCVCGMWQEDGAWMLQKTANYDIKMYYCPFCGAKLEV